MTDNIKKIIVGLVLVGALGGGAFLYLGQRPITYEEYVAVIRAYNDQVVYILSNCATDTRCIVVNNQARVNMGKASSKKDIVKKLNEWVGKGNAAYIR